MGNTDKKLVDAVIKSGYAAVVAKGNFGIEKENLRVEENGALALSEHPRAFGDKTENPYVKTDFSESQVEVITPAFESIREAYDFLENLTDIVNMNIDEEYLWPQSAPAVLPGEDAIPLADFGKGERGIEELRYREFLTDRYGKKLQMISGIHYNFSFAERLLDVLNLEGQEQQEFKNKVYMKVAKSLLINRWFLIYLTGASPFVHESYDEKHTSKMEKKGDICNFQKSLSLRNGFCGYRNEKHFVVPWDTLEDYVQYIESLVEDGDLTDAREFYSSLRLKGRDNKNLLKSLKRDGISYMELRAIDINPFEKNGISLESLYLTHLLIILALFTEDEKFGEAEQEIALLNQDIIANNGLEDSIELYAEAGKKVAVEVLGNEILDRMEELVNIFGLDREPMYRYAIERSREKINNRRETLGYKLSEAVKERGFIGFHIDQAKKFRQDSYDNYFKLHGYEDLELSTQILIKEAMKKGLEVELIDRRDNFITISNGKKKEYIKQATKTSLDSYITVMIMENKVVTKKILEENGIRNPKGETYSDIEEAKLAYEKFKGEKVVIKPKSTNFGVGITIFKDNYTKENFLEAIDIAFEFGDSVIVEEFIKGEEYRFLVIGDEVLAITKRVPANVTGDGESTVGELVEEKNKDILRGTDHKKPLEKINLGKIERLLLDSQGKSFDYIPESGEIVNLRENSNISTGGDSIDFTDEIHGDYKELAVRAAKTVDASFCGVDIIIEDISLPPESGDHSVIELNFNPAFYMHCYPYKGKRRDVADHILKELGLIEEIV